MELAALSLCSITTLARCTLQPGVEWNAKSIHCSTLVAVNTTICQVIPLLLSVMPVDFGARSAPGNIFGH